MRPGVGLFAPQLSVSPAPYGATLAIEIKLFVALALNRCSKPGYCLVRCKMQALRLGESLTYASRQKRLESASIRDL